MAREFDSHTVAVRYRTARMAQADLLRLPKYGWRVRQGDDACVLRVVTYKPEQLFGPFGAAPLLKRPAVDAPYRVRACWEHGVVSWSLACGCDSATLSSDCSARGVSLRLQPRGLGGSIFFPADDYIVERVDWPCVRRDDRASVSVRLPSDEGWRGRCIRVDVVELREALRLAGVVA